MPESTILAMSALLLSLAIPSLSLAEPRTPACAVFAEADAWDWPAQSTCGKLLPPPEPVLEEDGEDPEPDEAAASVCPLACQLLDPAPAPVVEDGDEDAAPAPMPCGDDVALCISPKANPAHREDKIDLSLFRKPDQEETAPPTPPPPLSHRPGLDHVFDWVKALNTCRTQTAAAIPRPEKPRKHEFESSASFSELQADYRACQEERAEELAKRHAHIEPVIEEVTFYAILRADNIGDYNADEGCFFPGVTARVELDDFKSKDAIYLNHYAATDLEDPIDDPKRRLIPRDTELRVELNSSTIDSVTLDPDSDRTVLLLTSHPVCVDAETGREYREQSALNGIPDFGIQAELTLQFRFEVSPNPDDPRETIAWPIWVVDGDFVYRKDADGTLLQVDSSRIEPASDQVRGGNINFNGNSSGCATASGRVQPVSVLILLGGLLGLRRRRG